MRGDPNTWTHYLGIFAGTNVLFLAIDKGLFEPIFDPTFSSETRHLAPAWREKRISLRHGKAFQAHSRKGSVYFTDAFRGYQSLKRYGRHQTHNYMPLTCRI